MIYRWGTNRNSATALMALRSIYFPISTRHGEGICANLLVVTDQTYLPEEWRPCPGFDAYEISDLGRCRNNATKAVLNNGINTRTGRRLYCLYRRGADGKSRSRTVRATTIVARAFLGERPPGFQVDHVNGIKVDDRVSNLAFVSPSTNVYRSYHVQNLHPNHPGSSKGNLTAEEYEQIKKWAAEGHSQVQIGKMLSPPRNNSTICRILSGKIRCRQARAKGRASRAAYLSLVGAARAERLLVLRGLLSGDPSLSVEGLAEALGVHVRTVFRDLRELGLEGRL